ncbi:MAG: hypothetical protein HY360_26515 [Verrucomicrobia bacterium]|nr:hypothetical protein [Verrucomicrobiota bacterium]
MIHNSFNKGPESWCSYDYHHCIVSGAGKREIFVLASWMGKGGVNDSGFVWTDHTTWSTDTPERPISILALLTYRHWVNADPVDLRGAKVSVHLRGDALRLFGGECYFWVNTPGSRWHLTSRPLTIGDGAWTAEPNRFTLVNDESLWHQSWAGYPPNPKSLDVTLGVAYSYGFSFVGFVMEPDGRFAMDEFQINLARH